MIASNNIIVYHLEDEVTECYKKQKDYDNLELNGQLGKYMERPKCDERGKFYPVKCITNLT